MCVVDVIDQMTSNHTHTHTHIHMYENAVTYFLYNDRVVDNNFPMLFGGVSRTRNTSTKACMLNIEAGGHNTHLAYIFFLF